MPNHTDTAQASRPQTPDARIDGRRFYDILYVIELRLRQSLDLLKASYNKTAKGNGWYHYLDSRENVGISSTAYAVALVKTLEPTFEGLPTAVQTVLANFKELENGPAGWAAPGTVLVEPTCYCIQELLDAGFLLPNSPVIQKSVRWFLSQQKDAGNWGPNLDIDTGHTYVTSLVIKLFQTLLSQAPEHHETLRASFHKGTAWLQEAVNPDGGWGRDSRDGASAWNTAHALNAMMRSGQPGATVERGVQYLIEHASKWSQTLTSEYDLPSGGRARYMFHPKPIVIMTLLHAGFSPYEPVIIAGVNEIIAAQDARGIWRYPGGQRGTIFELCHNATCLLRFKERSTSGSLRWRLRSLARV